MTVLLALASAAFYGCADFLGGFVSKRVPAAAVTVLSQVAGLPLLLILLVVVPVDAVTFRDVAFGAAAGLTGGLGLLALYAGLAVGRMAMVAPLTAIIAAGLPVAASLVSGQRPEALTLAGILLAIAAIPALAGGSANVKFRSPPSAVWLAVGAGVGFGVFFVLFSATSEAAGMWPLVGARATSIPALYLIARRGGRPFGFDAQTRNLAILTGGADMAANAFLLVAVQRGPLAVAATLASLYPGFTVLLARLVLGERFSGPQRIAVPLALAAIVLIAAP
jgi:uncharacterized membrane protein